MDRKMALVALGAFALGGVAATATSAFADDAPEVRQCVRMLMPRTAVDNSRGNASPLEVAQQLEDAAFALTAGWDVVGGDAQVLVLCR